MEMMIPKTIRPINKKSKLLGVNNSSGFLPVAASTKAPTSATAAPELTFPPNLRTAKSITTTRRTFIAIFPSGIGAIG
jgi:hypothetical protein